MARLLTLVVVLVCMMQVYECLKLPSVLKSKTAEEKEEEERLKAARLAYKRLFVRSGKLTREEILEGIQAMGHYEDQFEYDLDLNMLMEIQEPKEELCDSREYVEKLKTLVKTTRKQYKALNEWVNEAFEKQLALCNYEQRFATKLDQFKAQHPEQWHLVEDFNYFAGRHGIRMYDWKGKHMDNTPQMNNAMTEMFEDRVFRNHYEQREITYKAYNMAQELRSSCTNFADAIGGSLLMNTFRPNIKQDEQTLEWLRYLNVCDQVQRIDFSQAVHDMFHKTGYMPGQQAWNSYRAYRELWV